MAGREKKKKRPAPMGDAGTQENQECFATGSASPRPAGQSTSVDWGDVLDLLRSGIETDTWAAIQHCAQLHPTDDAAGLVTITSVVEWHGARLDPVAAYFGWLRPARYEQQRGGAYHVAGAGIGYVNIYQDRDRVAWPGVGPAPALVPVDDRETLCALGLCRAQRSDRDRCRSVLIWRHRRGRGQALPWGWR